MSCLRTAWERFTEQWDVLLVVTVVYFLVAPLTEVITDWIGNRYGLFIQTGWGVVSLLITALLYVGILTIFLDAVREQRPDPRDLVTRTDRVVPFIIGVIPFFTVVAFGSMLFILPGVYLAGRLAFFGLVLVDRPLGGLESLKKSWELTAGWRTTLQAVKLLAVCVFLNLAGALALGLGLLLTFPLAGLATAEFYQRLDSPEATTTNADLSENDSDMGPVIQTG